MGTSNTSFKEYFRGDILLLQLMGLYSMGSILDNTEPNSHCWEAVPFIAGIGTMSFGVLFDLRNVYEVSKTDLLSSIEAGGEVLSTILTIHKVCSYTSYRTAYG
uniref:Uncharacterized protein n=1 Tax=Bracon brevicornis TaxID=1563983 RepID=A0A6V7JLH2_9HYME